MAGRPLRRLRDSSENFSAGAVHRKNGLLGGGKASSWAVVYHGSTSPPEEFKKLIEGGFRGGTGSGATAGRGIYCVFSESATNSTFTGLYGLYVYRLTTKIDRYLVFDPAVATRVYGAPLSIEQQSERIGVDVVPGWRDAPGNNADGDLGRWFRGAAALSIRRFPDGLLGTTPDGDVAVLYNLQKVHLTGWSHLTGVVTGAGCRFAGGELDAVAWYDENSEGSTHPVGGKRANGFGLFDMSGNVAEWTVTPRRRGVVVAGGGWDDAEEDMDLTDKTQRVQRPDDRANYIGFRCVRTVQADARLLPGMVRIPKRGFDIDSHQVTQRAFASVMGWNPSFFQGGVRAEERPVESITLEEAVEYCRRLSAIRGLSGEDVLRIPVYLEWEHAAWGGRCERTGMTTFTHGRLNKDSFLPLSVRHRGWKAPDDVAPSSVVVGDHEDRLEAHRTARGWMRTLFPLTKVAPLRSLRAFADSSGRTLHDEVLASVAYDPQAAVRVGGVLGFYWRGPKVHVRALADFPRRTEVLTALQKAGFRIDT